MQGMDQDVRTDEAFRLEVCEWLKANGIDPGRTPIDPRAHIADGKLSLLQKVRRNGRDVIVRNDVLTERVTVPVKVQPSPSIAAWLG